MDLALLIPISAMAIPIVAIVMTTKKKIAELAVEEARLRRGEDVSLEEVEDLREEVGQLRADMMELQERVDFAERLLSQARDAGKLEPGSPNG